MYNYNPNRGTNNEEQDGEAFTRTAVKARMYHPDGSFWNGNQTIIRFQKKTWLYLSTFVLGLYGSVNIEIISEVKLGPVEQPSDANN